MGLFNRKKRFWIVFDTSQHPIYYRDVHDLLAAPRGYVIRYQYREALLSAQALECVSKEWPRSILCVYAQKHSVYERGKQKSLPTNDKANTQFVLTRCGTMEHIVKEGDKIFFDFQVSGYPNNHKTEQIGELLAEPVANGEVPWDTWVTVSDRYDLYEAISSGEDENNWRQAVELLGTPPMQFANDGFWRLKGPFEQSGRLITPTLRRVHQGAEIRRVMSEYRLKENGSFNLQVVSSVPPVANGDRPEYQVDADVGDSEKLKIIGSGKIELRHYDEKALDYVSTEMAPFKKAEVDLTMDTVPNANEWSTGAKLVLRHVVEKSIMASILGCLAGAIGVTLTVVGGSDLFKNDVLNGVKVLIVGLLLLAASKYMLTGKLEFGK